MARFGPRADRAADFRPGPGRANLQAQNRAKMGRRALTGPWKTGPGRAKTGRATARHKPKIYTEQHFKVNFSVKLIIKSSLNLTNL